MCMHHCLLKITGKHSGLTLPCLKLSRTFSCSLKHVTSKLNPKHDLLHLSSPRHVPPLSTSLLGGVGPSPYNLDRA
ncbi:hypothetical protein Ahy_B08g092983 isoform C [Arachis hypogaea]|uniref:Uncharacterized protein n=1 Tax=Arachis hypogaea TaxID=3818 RepID=A0A444Y523_ARAHY|nr:hypothetical protein Ahy_B08g092983 isoform C [Arachis hypogaea]